MNHGEIIRLPIAKLVTEPNPYRLNLFCDQVKLRSETAILNASCAELGIVAPLVVLAGENEEYYLLDGRSRLDYALLNGIDALDCRLIAKPRLVVLGRLLLALHREKIMSSTACRISFLSTVHKLGISRDALISEFLPLLGFEAHDQVLQKSERAAKLPANIMHFAHEKAYSLKQLVHLSRHPEKLIEALFSRRDEFVFTSSLLEELLTDIKDYLSFNDLTVAEFMTQDKIQAIMDNANLSAQERTQRLRAWVKEHRFPILTAARLRLEKVRMELGLPAAIRIDWDPFLEKREVRLAVQLSRPEEWSLVAARLKSPELAASIDKIFEEL